MGVVSGSNLIRFLSVFHITLAYYLLTSPSTIVDQGLVFILGAAMDIQPPSSFSLPSSPAALASLFLALIALSDLSSSNLPEEVGSYYWSSQAPVRLAFFFTVTAWSFLGKDGGMLARQTEKQKSAGIGNAADGVGNSVVFTWAFVEMLLWFWVYITLREERTEMMGRLQQRKKAEEDRLRD